MQTTDAYHTGNKSFSVETVAAATPEADEVQIAVPIAVFAAPTYMVTLVISMPASTIIE